MFPYISGTMTDPITRWTVEHSEKQRLVDLEVTDIRSKHIENLFMEMSDTLVIIVITRQHRK